MSILLAIIAINLFSIAGSLKTEAELNRQKLICIEFHKNKRQVRTASIEQVRQPINKKSIGAWKKYEKYFRDLVSELEA